MRKRYPKTDAEGIAAEIAKEYPRDIFYSDIQRIIKSHWGKKYPDNLFLRVCSILSENDIWVHS